MTYFRKLMNSSLLTNGLLERYLYSKEILGFERRVLAHLFTIPAFFLITFYSFFLFFTFRAFLVRPASEKRLKLWFRKLKKKTFFLTNLKGSPPEQHPLPVTGASPAAGSPSLLSIAWLFSLFLISPLFGLVPWFVIPWGWWTAAASSPGGWPAVLTPTARSLFVVVSVPLVSRVSSFLPLVLGLDLSVCSGVRPASGAASSTTIISVVAVEISSAVRCGKNHTIDERVRQVSKQLREVKHFFYLLYNLVFWNWIQNHVTVFFSWKAPKKKLEKCFFFLSPFFKRRRSRRNLEVRSLVTKCCCILIDDFFVV